MLSPTVSVLPPSPSPAPAPPEPTTRRRGLSYLRSLSSTSSAGTSDQPRTSPRHFFQRSSSYNNENKSNPTPGRRRSVSRPNEPTSPSSSRPQLTRVLSAGNSPNASPSPSPLPRFTEDQSSSANPQEETPRGPEPTNGEAEISAQNPTVTAAPSNSTTDEMTRSNRPSTPRRVTDSVLPHGTDHSKSQANSGARATSVSISNGSSAGVNGTAAPAVREGSDTEKPKLPMIRFFPHQDLRSNGRQSLNFSPVSRTLPTEKSIIRVGRYSEREGLPVANPTQPSDAPVGFKSKVVSRKHCEFSFSDGQWHIRDVASSSGTFLNHIRLSQPNQESKPFPIKDGDIVQLGIDFRGGEEMIFRCVKIRIECNRSWQKKPNTFNKSRQAQLLGLTKDQPTSGQNNGECSICLGSVLPCQTLFVAPCAHVWHYKCIRPMIEGRQSQYPSFQCPNCRAWTDLEADVDVVEEGVDAWVEKDGDTDDHLDIDQTERGQIAEAIPEIETAPVNSDANNLPPLEASVSNQTDEPPVSAASSGSLLSRRAVAMAGTSEASTMNNIAMPPPPNEEEMGQLAQQRTRTDSSNGDQIVAGEGPLTPRNNAGPFVFDGSGGTGESHRRTLFVPGLFEVAENAPTQ